MKQHFAVEEVKIEYITIGNRHRQDLGDIEGLARSMEDKGQLQPIGLTEELHLIWGERRLRAAEMLGWTAINAHVGPFEKFLELELDENEQRKQFDPLEVAEIGRALEAIEREKAKDRQGTRTDLDEHGGKLPPSEGGKVRDIVAKKLGVSGKTYEHAKAILEAAEDDPDTYGELVDQVQRTGKVNAAYSKLKKKRDEKRVQSLKPIEGKFHTLIIDPPWDFDWLSKEAAAAQKYATMTPEEIEDIQPMRWARPEFCHLYLWTPNNFMPIACRIVEAWGFEHRTILTWHKPKMGMGHYFRNNTEHVLFATRGKQTTRVDDICGLFEGSTGVKEHSDKPEEFRDIVEKASYGPYGEAFQRHEREGFVNLYEQIKAA